MSRAFRPARTRSIRARVASSRCGKETCARTPGSSTWNRISAGDAAVNLYLLVDLEPLLARYGNRGYRVAQLEGGLIGGRAYLASYALGLGATGLTFFDDSVTDFFSPHSKGKSVMFLLAFGVPLTSLKVV